MSADLPRRLFNFSPRLWPLLRLRCPYCGESSLLKPGSWFSFAPGCPRCDYRYEREDGYYTGASWMVNFPVVSTSGFVLGGLLLWLMPGADALYVAMIASVFMLVFGVVFTPYSMALWMWGEHLLHPLNEEDRLSHGKSSNA